MAAKTFYPLDAKIASHELGDMQEDGSAPTTATAVTGWIVATLSPPQYGSVNITTERTAGTFSATSQMDAKTAPDDGLGDAWRIPTVLTGSFAATAWTFAWFLIRDTAGAAVDGNVRMRVWRGTDEAGVGATEITSGAVDGATCTNISTTAQNSSISWSPGAVTLSGEYLFFQLEFQITGAGGTASDDVHIRLGITKVTTPDFTAGSAAGTSTSLRRVRRRRR